MSVSKATLFFALFIFLGYQVGFTLAYKLYPSSLMLIIFPPWMAAIGFAIITLPVGYTHSALMRYLLWRRRHSAVSVSAWALSTAVVLPVITVLSWLTFHDLQSAFGGPMIAPDGPAFTMDNATMNVVIKYGVTFLTGAWGSTFLLLREKARAAAPAE